jgi:hypothetical protein
MTTGNSSKRPHPHAATIKAWADGATIQFYDERTREHRWVDCINNQPSWNFDMRYRVKPTPTPDYQFYYALRDGDCRATIVGANIRATFDGSTGVLKKVDILHD